MLPFKTLKDCGNWPQRIITNLILCEYVKVCDSGWPDEGLNVPDSAHYTNIVRHYPIRCQIYPRQWKYLIYYSYNDLPITAQRC
jgi:hypothetical protein